MYRRRLSHPFPINPNLKFLLLENNKNLTGQCYRFTLMIRQVSKGDTIRSVRGKLEVFFKSNNFWGALQDKVLCMPRSLKDQSASVLRMWAHQCECVFAQRLRRGQQMLCLYSKLWGEHALRDLIKQMGQRLGGRGRDIAIGALGFVAYDWRSNRISEHEIKSHINELDYIYKLKDKTLCDKCSKNSRICACEKFDGTKKKKRLSSYDDWKLFIEKNDLVVWRRMHKSGTYEYKVYGSYPDVSAEDFLNVQIDIDYRRQWDKTAVSLNVVEVDPDPTTNSDVVYWEMLWPKLFANRDYVFHRRYLVDYKSKTLFLYSKSTKHPNCPKEQTKYRIEDYWSYMVIKPYTELNKPGIEFSLTYYDNPGVNIPASVTAWVAMKAMPDFLERLRDASRKYRTYCQKSGVCRICNIRDDTHDSSQVSLWTYFDDEDDVVDNTIYEARHKIKKGPGGNTIEPQQNIPELDNATTENHSFWR